VKPSRLTVKSFISFSKIAFLIENHFENIIKTLDTKSIYILYTYTYIGVPISSAGQKSSRVFQTEPKIPNVFMDIP